MRASASRLVACSKRSVSSSRGPRQHLERDLRDHARACRASRQQARHVVARDVLHHLAAETQDLARRRRAPRAEHEVAHRARASARRGPDKSGRDAAADRRVAAEMRRLEGSIWPLGREQRLDSASGVPQRAVITSSSARSRRCRDSRVRRAARRAALAVEVLACRRRTCAAACCALRRLHARCAELSDACSMRVLASESRQVGKRQLAAGARACAPYSAQRCSVGIALPGLSRPCGSNARLTPWKASAARPANCAHIWLSFSTPTPCSPVIVPPTATHSSRMSAAEVARRARSSSGLAGVEQDQRMQVAVAGMEHVRAAQAVLRSQRLDAAQHLAPGAARDRAVHAVVVGRERPGGRERRPCARPKALPLGLVGATRADRWRRGAAARLDALRLPRRLRRRVPSDLAQQDRLRRRSIAGLTNGSTARIAMRSIISSPAGMMPAAMIVAHRLARLARRRRTPPCTTLRPLGLRQQLHRHFGDDAAACPREPVSSASRSKPGRIERVAEPSSRSSPSIVSRARRARCAR